MARVGVIDVDLHLNRDPTPDEVRGREEYARKKYAELTARGVSAALLRHHQFGSLHINLFTKPIGSTRLGRWLAAFVADRGGIEVDPFPSATGGGNAVRRPGRHHKRPDSWTEVLLPDGTWGKWPACVGVLIDLADNPADKFPDPASRSPTHRSRRPRNRVPKTRSGR